MSSNLCGKFFIAYESEIEYPNKLNRKFIFVLLHTAKYD